MLTNDKDVFFTLKFYRGKEGAAKNYNFPFKFELDFNYPFNPFSDQQQLQRDNVAVKPGTLEGTMTEAFQVLTQFFQFVDDLAKNDSSKNETYLKQGLSQETFNEIQRLFGQLGSVSKAPDVKQVTINRISYSQFNPRELNVSTNLSINGDIKPPRL